jgi:hypothetical protein
MSNYIVLVKQVPDVTQITGNAFDPETGTLKRGVLPSVINKLDTDALAFASKMRQASPGKIVCLTMGPPMAKDILIYSLTGTSWGLTLNIEYARIKQVDIKVILPVHEEILAKQNIPPLQKNRRSLELLVLICKRIFIRFLKWTGVRTGVRVAS